MYALVKPALAPSTPTPPHRRCRRLLPARQTTTPPHRRWLPVLPPGSQIWLPGSLSSRGTRHVRFDRSLLFSQITFGDEMCEDPRASYEAPPILHTLISGPGAAVSNSARTEKRTAQ